MWKAILTKGTRVVGKTLSILSLHKYPIVTGSELAAGDFVQVWDEASIIHGEFATVKLTTPFEIVIEMLEEGHVFRPPLQGKFKLIERP